MVIVNWFLISIPVAISPLIITTFLLSLQTVLWDRQGCPGPNPNVILPCFSILKIWGIKCARRFLWHGSSSSILKWLHLLIFYASKSLNVELGSKQVKKLSSFRVIVVYIKCLTDEEGLNSIMGEKIKKSQLTSQRKEVASPGAVGTVWVRRVPGQIQSRKGQVILIEGVTYLNT